MGKLRIPAGFFVSGGTFVNHTAMAALMAGWER
jgi:hypothetical protein